MANGIGSIQGGIHVNLDHYAFSPGELVTGTVYIRLNEDVPAATLYLILKGREKTRWEGKKDNSLVAFRGENILTNFTYPLFRWQNGQSSKDLRTDFTLALPPILPGTFSHIYRTSKSTIKYMIKAKLVSAEDRTLKHKTAILIKQSLPNDIINSDLIQEKTASLKTCCSSQGSTKVKAYFPKDFYETNEAPSVIVEIDNRESKLDVHQIQAHLWRIVTINNFGDDTHQIETKIISANAPGVGKGDVLLAENTISLQLNLPAVKEKIANTHTCHGRLIQCSYIIEVRAKMNGRCMCSAGTPSVFCPMVIVPDSYPPPPSPPAPEGWNPQVLEPIHIPYDERYEVHSSVPAMG